MATLICVDLHTKLRFDASHINQYFIGIFLLCVKYASSSVKKHLIQFHWWHSEKSFYCIGMAISELTATVIINWLHKRNANVAHIRVYCVLYQNSSRLSSFLFRLSHICVYVVNVCVNWKFCQWFALNRTWLNYLWWLN